MISPVSSSSLVDTSYKFNKYLKHTAPAASDMYPINSVFDDPTYQAYQDYVVSTTASGFLEIDDLGRKSLIWYAGRHTGAEYQNGVYVAPTDGVKLVLCEDDSRMHAFPIGASPGRTDYCPVCGQSICLW